MNKKIVAVLLSILFALSACAIRESETNPFSLSLESTVLAPETPGDYLEIYSENPFEGNRSQAEQGEILYQANCVSCHGETGQGDGHAGRGLEPKPGNLAESIGELSDAYLYWRISEGGLIEPFNSLMPGWKGLLNEEQIWQVITHLRSLGL